MKDGFRGRESSATFQISWSIDFRFRYLFIGDRVAAQLNQHIKLYPQAHAEYALLLKTLALNLSDYRA